jgi:hypothetical protein
MNASAAPSHSWTFFRAGGVDQVALSSGEDLLHLKHLDQKLWVALACPVRGLDLDARTLALLDADGDGRIRAADVVEAIDWLAARLTTLDGVLRAEDRLELRVLREDRDEARHLRKAAAELLAVQGVSGDAGVLTTTLTAKARDHFDALPFNGDGVVPVAVCEDDALAAAAADLLTVLEGQTDRSGEPGLSAACVEEFETQGRAWLDWLAAGQAQDEATLRPLGEDTAAAWESWREVRAWIDDHFVRCRWLAFDPAAATALQGPAVDAASLADRSLTATDPMLERLPLARPNAELVLPLGAGINPARAAAMDRFRARVVQPLLGERDALDPMAWQQVCERLHPWDAWQAAAPQSRVGDLGEARVRALLEGPAPAGLRALIAEDELHRPQAESLDALDRLARLHRDLARLLRNFVSFEDFYIRRGAATFQVGTLYLDGRSCRLCVRVDDPARHTTLAGMSHVHLVYCALTRPGEERMHIVAGFTAGDSDFLLVGRNGVFYDHLGRDWDATVTSIVEQPISIRQAFWSPYRKLARFISEQAERFAAGREQAIDQQAQSAVAGGADRLQAGAPAARPAAQAGGFDVGRFAGIFAAVGLAIGVIGSALAALLSGFLALRIWQMPLALGGLLLLISGPSMLMAALKLQQRNLGPLLDASGWAINARARINLAFGGVLTQVGELPKGTRRTLGDPYADRRFPWKSALVLVLVAMAFVWAWEKELIQPLLWPEVPEEPAAEPTPPEALEAPAGAEAAPAAE